MTNTSTVTVKIKKQRYTTKNAIKNFDYTTIADRLRMVSWSNDLNHTGVVKPVNGIPTFPITAKALYPKELKGYTPYHRMDTSHERASGWSSIFIRNDVTHSSVHLDTTNLQAAALKITLSFVFTLCSVYAPPRN